MGTTTVWSFPYPEKADSRNVPLHMKNMADTIDAALKADAAAGTASMRKLGTGATDAAAGNDSRLSDARAPTGSAGGDLSGTYPNPQIASGVIVDGDVATANKDGAVGTPSLRTLGTGAQQAAAGNDSRLSNARAPTAHKDTHTRSGSDPFVGTDELDARARVVHRKNSVATDVAVRRRLNWIEGANVSITIADDSANEKADVTLAAPVAAGTVASRPAAGVAGRLYWGTDNHVLYRDDGSTWTKIAVADYEDLSNIPTAFAPSTHKSSHVTGGSDAFAAGDLLDATAKYIVRKNSGADVGPRRAINLIEGTGVTLTVADDSANEEVEVTIASSVGTQLVPTGAVFGWLLLAPPSGWLICDGQAVSRSTYAALFALLGTFYGVGDGSTTFNLPNMKGRVPVGFDGAQTEFDTIGETGGAKTVAISVANMPSHGHAVTDGVGGGLYRASGAGGLGAGSTIFARQGGTTQAVRADDNGSDSPHNNLQPYITQNFIIKT